MKNEKITEAIVKLNAIGDGMYSKFGTESYIERCELHDIKELLKQVNGDSTSKDQALNLAGVSNNEVVVCPMCKSTHTIYSDFLKEYQCAKCNHHWAN